MSSGVVAGHYLLQFARPDFPSHFQFCGSFTSAGLIMLITTTLLPCGLRAAQHSSVFLRSGGFTCQSGSSHNQSVLCLQDVAIDNRDNPSILYVSLRHSKTNIFGAGITIHLGRTGDILCPVSALLAYLACRPPTPGPLFLLQSGKPLSHQLLVSKVRHTLESAGLDVAQYNGHSFRIGAATSAAEAGLNDSTIRQLGRWKSSAFTRYLCPPVEMIAQNSRTLLQSDV